MSETIVKCVCQHCQRVTVVPQETVRQLLSEAEKEIRAKTLEDAAAVAERDVDWSAFGKRDIQPWENGNDSVRDYRLGIATGRAIAASIRALQSEER